MAGLEQEFWYQSNDNVLLVNILGEGSQHISREQYRHYTKVFNFIIIHYPA